MLTRGIQAVGRASESVTRHHGTLDERMWWITPPANPPYELTEQETKWESRIRQQIMPIHPIIRYPDPRLALPAKPVTVFDGALRDLASDLLETMHAAPGYRDHRAAYRHLLAGRGARPRSHRWRANLCQSGDHLGIARDDPASGRQRLDARCQRRHNASCARPDQLSRRPRQHADRGIGGSARCLPPA